MPEPDNSFRSPVPSALAINNAEADGPRLLRIIRSLASAGRMPIDTVINNVNIARTFRIAVTAPPFQFNPRSQHLPVSSHRSLWQAEALYQALVSGFGVQAVELGIAEHDNAHHPLLECLLEI